MMYLCLECKFKSEKGEEYFRHLSRHRIDKDYIFKCWNCLSTFKNFSSYRTHYANYHSTLAVQKSVNSGKCKQAMCYFFTDSGKELAAHVRTHFPNIVECPFGNCSKTFSNKNYFNVHITRYHRSKNIEENSVVPAVQFYERQVELPAEPQFEPRIEPQITLPNHSIPITSNSNDTLSELFLRLKTENFVSETVVQSLVEEFQIINDDYQRRLEESVETFCIKENVSALKESLMTEVKKIEVFPQLSKIQTTYLRDKHYKSSKHYVKPVKIMLGVDDHHNSCLFRF
jgi:hypothetical protein